MKHTRRTINRITASLLCCLMLPAMPVSAEEETVKDFLYYHTLSDYEVYLEYCELYGFEAEASLPEETLLPDYQFLRHYTTSGVHGVVFYVYCDEDVPYEIDTRPEMFGMPAEWYENKLLESGEDYELYSFHQVVGLEQTAGITTTENGTLCHYYQVEYCFPAVEYFVPDYVQGSYEDSIVDIYRVRLSLHHSDFVAQYACHEDDINVSPVVQYYTINGGNTRPEVFGDVNGDYVVDTRDSACILQYAAAVGAGYNGSLKEYLAQ